MTYVDDAVAEESDLVRNILTVIGFVHWGVIYGRDNLVCNALGDHEPVSQSKLQKSTLVLNYNSNFKLKKRENIERKVLLHLLFF